MFWIEDISELLQPTLIPTDYMRMDEKLNALTRLIIFVCLILALVMQDSKIILLMIILVLLVVVIYKYQKGFEKEVQNFLDEKEIKVVDSSVCKKPTKNNPFMNPSLLDIKPDEDSIKACPLSDADKAIDDLFDSGMYKDANDIYDRNTMKRQFYTVPGSSIPNDQGAFANWLYNRGKSCKEDNGEQCYRNIYQDLRMN